MLEEAITLPASGETPGAGQAPPQCLDVDGGWQTQGGSAHGREGVRSKRSLAGEYYESFDVNWKNCSAQSMGTTAWIAEYGRFLKRCVAEEKKGDPAAVREAFDILFGLVDRIDQCVDEVLFFADDGGSWQFGEDWHEILPPWFRVLSATAAPEEYAERVLAMLKARCDLGQRQDAPVARKTATPEQRKALAALEAREKA